MTERKIMDHKIYRVLGFEILGMYTLEVRFDDGTRQTIDFQPVLAGEIFGPLLDEKLFKQVEIDPEVHTLVWPNGADFDPSTLHDWPRYLDELKRLAKSWTQLKTT
jgi:hypothetical protein